MRFPFIPGALCALLACGTTPAFAQTHAETTIPYLVSLPAETPPDQQARVVLVMPPGTQSESIARITMDRAFGDALAAHGYVIVMPYVADARAKIGVEAMTELLHHVSSVSGITTEKAVVVGIQNGAKAAFEFAVKYPERVAGLLIMPGLPPREWMSGEAHTRMLSSLKSIPVSMYVGSTDTRWRADMEPLAADLAAAGIACTLKVVEGDGHALSSITPDRIADAIRRLDRLAAGITPENEVGSMLDAWHDAAARADEDAYFSAFADADSIFMGTDATERWTATEFRAWAKPYFERGRAWSFKVVERHVYLSPDESLAWFDEVLDTPNMGPCRGSGVAVRLSGGWKVAHYNLTVPVPNAILDRVVEMVKQESSSPTLPTKGGD
ncbi:MAG: nuclear transport factor 2 family protein [Phycisphaeraceae bacterium]|nr:nuclear transport factor 2 family protein [Phycisphaeraceae bacterium]